MKKRPGLSTSTFLVVVTVTVLAGGVTVVSAPPSESDTIRGGSGIPAGLDLPVAEPIYARPVREVIATEGGGALPLSYGGDPYKAIGTIAGGVCQFDFQCNDCNPCTIDKCDLPSGSSFGTCSNLPADTCTSCDDGVFCNGHDHCNTHGQCISDGVDPCAGDPTALCDENGGALLRGSCEPICASDADCFDDGLFCNGTEFCDLMECVGGVTPAPGTPCTSDADCDTVGGGFCGGVCRDTGSPCGDDVLCYEVGDTCGQSRCCREDGANPGEYLCSHETEADCEAGGGAWLGLAEEIGAFVSCVQNSLCPLYASGIAVGEPQVAAGPIGHATCDAVQELGDDYAITNASPSEYLLLHALRLIWGFDTVGIEDDPSRVRITFYDASGNVVEEFITDPGTQTHQPTLRTILFADPPVIPSTGFVSIQTSARYSPYGRHYWMSTTAADVGTNDPDVLWVNGAATDASLLGGSPGVLAFELVGERTDAPMGGCCMAENGDCFNEVPWICEGVGGTPLGPGYVCRRCRNNLFKICNIDADCPACVGDAVFEGNGCTSDADCGTGTCTGTAPCDRHPSDCDFTACCNPTTGECATIYGDFVCEDFSYCLTDDDCIGIGDGSCRPRCEFNFGPGWISQGSGTSCYPNCCEQPAQNGGDTCDTASIRVVNVPPPGDSPVTVTVTGDNSTATFGDFVGDGSGTCEEGLHDPAGAIQDRGWWEAFDTDACAYVRVDYCCTESVSGDAKQPQWAFLREGCDPCGSTIDASVLPEPIGDGLSPYGAGEPFCDGDDAWHTYGPLPAGTYYHNVYSAPNGTFGPYQLHITAMACPEAACCLPESQCVDGNSEHVLFDGLGEPVPCTGDGDCPAGGVCRTCALANELDCAAADGFRNGPGNVPEDIYQITSCDGAPCEIGSCCSDLGACDDQADPATACDPAQPLTCMSRSQCEGSGGTFRGGERCDFPNWPCQSVGVPSPENCQYPPNLWTDASDLAMPPNGTVSADDFIPEGDTVETVTVWGVYTDWRNASLDPPYDCIDDYIGDAFRVRIYADGGGLPGTLIGERYVIGSDITRQPEPGTPFETNWFHIISQRYDLLLDPPIIGLVPGERHWLEVANGANRIDDSSAYSGYSCVWNWHQHYAGGARDEFSARGTNDRSIGGAPPAPGSGYLPGSGYHIDRAFCLKTTLGAPLPFAPGPEELGACFDCGTELCTSRTQADCVEHSGSWVQDDPSCSQPYEHAPGDNCASTGGLVAGSVCAGGVPNGVLDPGEACDDGDDTNPLDGCHGCLLNCPPVDPEGGPIVISEDGLYAFDTTCTTRDGNKYVTDWQGRQTPFGKDIWFAYTAPHTGRMFASLCPTGNAADRDNGYDSYIALYGNAFDDPRTCPCPGLTGAPVDSADENCNGLGDAGGGVISHIVLTGECYLIRVGGWNSASGQGLLDVGLIYDPCYLEPANPPVLETIVDWAGAEVVSAKNRFLSFNNSSNPGRIQGVRVTIVSLPPPFDAWNGAQLWVGEPVEISENGAAVGPLPGFPNFWAAPLKCDPASAHFADWDADYGTVHVYHEGIVPSGVYELQVIDEDCATAGVSNYSVPATVVNAPWGDAVGSFDPVLGMWTAPDGSVDVSKDIVAALDKFSSLPTAPTKARVDIEPAEVDFLINITDVTRFLDAFHGGSYLFSPSGPTPCP